MKCPDTIKACDTLCSAAERGHKDCLQVLLQAGASKDIQNAGGRTAKDLALMRGPPPWPTMKFLQLSGNILQAIVIGPYMPHSSETGSEHQSSKSRATQFVQVLLCCAWCPNGFPDLLPPFGASVD